MAAENWTRRRRMSRPGTLVFFGLVFLLLPFVNYAAYAARYGIPPAMASLVLKTMPWPFVIMMLLSFPVGLGLLLVKKWGWFLFLAYSVLLVAYNVYVILTNHDPYNFLALALTTLGCVAIVYFSRKDVSAPYMKMYPRGWRGQRRVPVEIPIRVGEKNLKSRDISPSGFYADWPDCPHNPNDAVRLIFELDGEELQLEGGVVRVDDNGAGIAFRGLTREQSALLEKFA